VAGQPVLFLFDVGSGLSSLASRGKPPGVDFRATSAGRAIDVRAVHGHFFRGLFCAFQGIVILCLAGLAGVPRNPILILAVIGELLLLSFAVTEFGVMTAARITRIQAFTALTQVPVMPLFLLSGALHPLRSPPAWLTALTRFDPVRAGGSHGVWRRDIVSHGNEQNCSKIKGRRRVATGANHPASLSSAFRRGPGTPAVVPRRGTRAPI
jgi:hypothetical protein